MAVSNLPVIKSRDILALSPWVTLVDRAVLDEHGHLNHFHSLRQSDYVTVYAETHAGEVVLVKQYRPALEAFTLELPGGLREKGEDPSVTASRELEEETGFRPRASLDLLGSLAPDTGRLENRLWCFRAHDIEAVSGWQPEQGVENILLPKKEFFHAIRVGEFNNALHIAIVCLVMLRDQGLKL